MKPTYSPKFVSTITALSLSLCASNLAAHHPDTKWYLFNLTKTDHKGNGRDAHHITTISPKNGSDSGMIKALVNGSSQTLTSLLIQDGKTINGTNQIINVSNSQHTISIPTITNKGILLGNTRSNNVSSIVSPQGVVELQNATVTNFTNTGTINAKGGNAVMLKNATITTFINESLIETESQHRSGRVAMDDIKPIYSAFLIDDGSTISSLHNKGTIKAKNTGINVNGKAHIAHLKNSGTITIQNGDNHNHSAGIMLVSSSNSGGSYGTIENTGAISGGKYGVYLEGGSIDNLKNSGNIDAKKDGIGFYSPKNGDSNTTIQNLEVEKGTIKGGENGINISKTGVGPKHQAVVQNLTIKETATVEGGSGSGLILGNHDNSTKNGQGTYKLTGKIQVDGILKGSKAGITNYGHLGSDGQDAIVVGKNGKIDGIVKNENGGTFKGNITNESSHALQIDNQGKVGNEIVITNNGTGNIEIKDWKLEKQDNGNGLKALKFEGNGNGKITLEKLTIDVDNANINNENLKAAFQGSKKTEALLSTQVASTKGEVKFSGDLLRGLVANIDGSKT
ncbi:MAG: hypothetical protein PUJ79_00020, partial [Helicobacter sp.]|nr:hypothetical protein [Helicobacter sp.]MDY5740313.1 hypothetical protein [Helicobacter sp.]